MSRPARQEATQTHFHADDNICGCPELWGLSPPPSPANKGVERHAVSLRSALTTTLAPLARSDSSATGHTDLSLSTLTHENTGSTTEKSYPPRRGRSSFRSLTPSRHPTFPSTFTPTSSLPAKPRETCFFWYHGDCRSGTSCPRAHEVRITWPIPPPRGFVHFEKCDLPLCPLRDKLKSIETSLSFTMEPKSSNIVGRGDRIGDDGLAPATGFTMDNHARNGFVPLLTTPNILHSQSFAKATSKDNVLATAAAPEREGFSHISSISHIGTARNSNNVAGSASITVPLYATQRNPAFLSVDNQGKVILVEANDDNTSIRPRGGMNYPVAGHERPFLYQADTATRLHASGNQHPATAPIISQQGHSPNAYMASAPFTPKGPRGYVEAQNQTCFYWYHYGYCPNCQREECCYQHRMTVDSHEVGLPENVDLKFHDPRCQLALCPLRVPNQELASEPTDGPVVQKYLGVRGQSVHNGKALEPLTHNTFGTVGSFSGQNAVKTHLLTNADEQDALHVNPFNSLTPNQRMSFAQQIRDGADMNFEQMLSRTKRQTEIDLLRKMMKDHPLSVEQMRRLNGIEYAEQCWSRHDAKRLHRLRDNVQEKGQTIRQKGKSARREVDSENRLKSLDRKMKTLEAEQEAKERKRQKQVSSLAHVQVGKPREAREPRGNSTGFFNKPSWVR